MLCRYWAVTSHFFECEMKFLDGIGEKLLPTNAVPISSLNPLIIHKSLSKNMK